MKLHLPRLIRVKKVDIEEPKKPRLKFKFIDPTKEALKQLRAWTKKKNKAEKAEIKEAKKQRREWEEEASLSGKKSDKGKLPKTKRKLLNALEKAKRKFIKQETGIETGVTEISEDDLLIANFKQAVEQMASDDYMPKYHNFNPNSTRTAKGSDMKYRNVETLVGYGGSIGGQLSKWISSYGIHTVAQNIKQSGEALWELIEGIIFALYDKRYARWSNGGASSLAMAIATLEYYLSRPINEHPGSFTETASEEIKKEIDIPFD